MTRPYQPHSDCTAAREARMLPAVLAARERAMLRRARMQHLTQVRAEVAAGRLPPEAITCWHTHQIRVLAVCAPNTIRAFDLLFEVVR